MAANLITFDSEYMREYVKTVDRAQRLVDEARACLKKANRHDGWRCQERHTVNNKLNSVSSRLDRVSGGLRETSASLVRGAGQFADLESRSQKEENSLSGQLKKNWLFEAIKWVAGAIGGAIIGGAVGGIPGVIIGGTIGGIPKCPLPVTPVPSLPGGGEPPKSFPSPYLSGGNDGNPYGAQPTPGGAAQPSGSSEIPAPNLDGPTYGEYRGETEPPFFYQCVGYAKGRLAERGINIGQISWGNGKFVANNLNGRYPDGNIPDSDYSMKYYSDGTVKAPAIASFNGVDSNGHVIFVEDVWTDENGVTQVRYSEANALGNAGQEENDGKIHGPITLEEFKALSGGMKDLVHFDKPS